MTNDFERELREARYRASEAKDALRRGREEELARFAENRRIEQKVRDEILAGLKPKIGPLMSMLSRETWGRDPGDEYVFDNRFGDDIRDNKWLSFHHYMWWVTGGFSEHGFYEYKTILSFKEGNFAGVSNDTRGLVTPHLTIHGQLVQDLESDYAIKIAFKAAAVQGPSYSPLGRRHSSERGG